MKKLVLLPILILAFLFSNAQTQSGNVNDLSKKQTKQRTSNTQKSAQQGGFRKENLRFGGNFGAGFGTITMVDISPTVGYQFTPMVQAGMGVIYNYYADNRFTPRLSMNIFGINPYAQFSPIRYFFLRAEYGFLNYDTNFSSVNVKREWVHYPLVGGGVILPVGQNGGITATLLWNLNDTPNSIYANNPIFRMGFVFGL